MAIASAGLFRQSLGHAERLRTAAESSWHHYVMYDFSTDQILSTRDQEMFSDPRYHATGCHAAKQKKKLNCQPHHPTANTS